MNRIEEKMTALKNEGRKAFITYTTAGLPAYFSRFEVGRIRSGAGTIEDEEPPLNSEL